nr:PQQ-binding-like beta-propeller repeat protein [Cellulosimicrobium arenosum]
MRRRAASADRRTFEFVDATDHTSDAFDDEPLDAPPAGARAHRTPHGDRAAPVDGRAGTDEPDPAARAASRRHRMRAALAAAGALAVVLAGMAAVDAVTSRNDRARLVAAEGALLQADAAPHVTWSLEASFPSDPVSFVSGAVVVSDGSDVVGYGLDSGEEAWRASFDDPTLCGPSARWPASRVRVQESLVCVPGGIVRPGGDGGEHEPATVTHLGADGQVLASHEVDVDEGPDPSSTELGDVRWKVVAPGPDGGLLWVGRAGPVPEGQGEVVEIDPETGSPDVLGNARDAVAVMQDAATGAVRWIATVSAESSSDTAFSCVRWDSTQDGERQEGTADLDPLWAFTNGGVVVLQGCAVNASLSASTGARLDDPARADDEVVPFGDRLLRDPTGGVVMDGAAGQLYDESGEPMRSVVLADDGSEVWEAPGFVFPPSATDGTSTSWFASDEGELVAFDHAGERRWVGETAGRSGRVLVATREVVVVPTSSGLAGLDAVTGTERWTLEIALHDVQQAFTDGRTAVLRTNDGTGDRLVGIDLAGGRVAWESDGADGYSSLVAAEGRLLQLTEHSIDRLG